MLLCRSRGKFYVTRFLPECPGAWGKEIFGVDSSLANSEIVAIGQEFIDTMSVLFKSIHPGIAVKNPLLFLDGWAIPHNAQT